MFSLVPRTTSTLSDLFDSFWGDLEDGVTKTLTKYTANPAVDIEELDNKYVITADIPGVDKGDISVTAENGILSIKAEKKFDKKDEKKGYKYYERRASSYERSFRLTDGLDTENIEAALKDGVLTVTVPKKESTKTKKIEIR